MMSRLYLNSPSLGCSIPAEEFDAGALPCSGSQICPPPVNGCACGGAVPCGSCADNNFSQGPACCQQMICCCRPAAPVPQPIQVEEDCCCKESFRAALGLLRSQEIASLLDFDTAAFITGTYTAGTRLKPNPPCEPSGAPQDNLGKLEGAFHRFTPCSCDLLDIDAALYSSAGTAVNFTASQMSLCALDAAVIQAAEAAAEGMLSAAEATARNFRSLCAMLAERISPACGSPCACSSACGGQDCCCCAQGLLGALAQNNLSRRVSLTAGLLVLENVTLLGAVGTVLVLANEGSSRLYFVCVNSVEFIG